jgi:hypothetical protein
LHTSLDDVINDALLLSDLRKPPTINTKADKEGRAVKKTKIKNLSPVLFTQIKTPSGKKKKRMKTKLLIALVDSGASESILKLSSAKGVPLRQGKESKSGWSTAAGMLDATAKTKKLEFSLPELHANRTIRKSFHIVSLDIKRYDMIIGRDLIMELGLDAKGCDLSIKWDDVAIPWRDMDSTVEDIYLAENHFSRQPMEPEIKRMTDILDAKYTKANLEEIVKAADHLNYTERDALYKLIQKYEDLFDGTLGTFTGTPYDIKLKENVEPFHIRAFPVPKIHEYSFKSEIERLVSLGVLKKVNRSQWGAPTFLIPKKDGTVNFISNFRELNKRIKRQPYPIPKIQDLLLKIEDFQYRTSLDLNMGYYHIELSAHSKELCTIITQWGKFEYQRLPMGSCNSPDVFQEKMSELLNGLDTARVYLDDILHVTKGSWQEHLEVLYQVFNR